MRIGYYVPQTLLRHSGIAARVSATLEVWSHSHDVVLLGDLEPARGRLPAPLSHFGGEVRQLRDARRAKLDHVHVRLLLPLPGWGSVSSSIGLEVHAGLRRAESGRDQVRVLLGGPSAARLVATAKLGAFVTRELSELEEYRCLPAKVILGNGIRLDDVMPAPANARPIVGMAIGRDAPWHGLDRFATLAQANRDFRFRVIAPQSVAAQLLAAPGLEGLSWLPTRDRAEYLAGLASLDVAVGSMAMERAGLTEAAPLKVRDYVSMGIPAALPFHDTNLHGVADPAILEWDGRPSEAFSEWVVQMVGRRVGESAREAVDIEAIEAQRLAAISASLA